MFTPELVFTEFKKDTAAVCGRKVSDRNGILAHVELGKLNSNI